MEKEIWKNIPGYEDEYKISTEGTVVSKQRVVSRNNNYNYTVREKILKPNERHGRYQYKLSKEGVKKNYSASSLMALTFLNHTYKSHHKIIDHIDGNPKNNKLNNLQIISQRENSFKDKKKKYVGVYYNKKHKYWYSQIYFDGKLRHLGIFKCPKKASKVYLKKHNELIIKAEKK